MFPIPTSKTDHSDTLQYATVGTTEDPEEDVIFEIGLMLMYQFEVLGAAGVGELAGTLLPLLPGAFDKTSRTFKRMPYDTCHAMLAAFLKYAIDTKNDRLQETITHLMRKLASERLGAKGLDETQVAALGNWESDLAKAFVDAYRRIFDQGATAMKLSDGHRATPSCCPFHLQYKDDFEVRPFAGFDKGAVDNVRDKKTKELLDILTPVMMRTGALLYHRYPGATVWTKLSMFKHANFPAYADKVCAWVEIQKTSEVTVAEAALAEHHVTLNRGLGSMMTGVGDKVDRLIDVLAKLISDGPNEDLTKLSEALDTALATNAKLVEVNASQQRTILWQQDMTTQHAAQCAAELAQADHDATRPAGGGPALSVRAQPPATSLPAMSLPAMPMPVTTGALGQEWWRYRDGDEKLATFDDKGKGMYSTWGGRFRAKTLRFAGKSLAEALDEAGSVSNYLGVKGNKKGAGTHRRQFEKAIKADKYVLDHFRATNAVHMSKDELAADCYVRADEHFKTAYPTMNRWYVECVQDKKQKVACGRVSCGAAFVVSSTTRAKKCSKCGSSVCAKCGALWAEGHKC